MSQLNVPSHNDLIMFSKTPKVSVLIAWKEKRGSKWVSREELYYGVRCHWTRDTTFKTSFATGQNADKGGVVQLYVASVLMAPEYHDTTTYDLGKKSLISPLLEERKHVALFSSAGNAGMVQAKLDDQFHFGQNSDKTSRFLVYHPKAWNPKQCHFVNGGTSTLAWQNAVAPALKLATELGVSFLPGASTAADAIAKTGLVPQAVNWAQKGLRNSFGHPLRKFDGKDSFVTSEAAAKEELKEEARVEELQSVAIEAVVSSKTDDEFEKKFDELLKSVLPILDEKI